MPARDGKEDGALTPAWLYGMLEAHYGRLDWWPAESPFEIMVGAVLTQRTAWGNVEMALERLRTAGIASVEDLLALTTEELEGLVRSSGTYRQKAGRLKRLFSIVERDHRGDIEAFLDRPAGALRQDLLSVHGIGPETADSIVLYAAGRPAFVVDAYTRRVLERLGTDAGRTYDEVAAWFTSGLPEDPDLYNNFHAVLVELGKDHCRMEPLCKGCPLETHCPYPRISLPEKRPGPSVNRGYQE